MQDKLQLTMQYVCNGQVINYKEGDSNIKIVKTVTDNGLKILLKPQKSIRVKKIALECAYDYKEDTLFYANGFQSWTDTKEFSSGEVMPRLGWIKGIFKLIGLDMSGDYRFTRYSKKSGFFHAFTYCYFRNKDNYELIGSLDERTGYTILYADFSKKNFVIEKDLEGIEISDSYTAFDLFFDKGEYNAVFDNYFNAMGIKAITNEQMRGYTSWYNYYQNISEKDVLRDLESLKKYNDKTNVFQIDDGYQTAVGDWLSVDTNKFPSGTMKTVADKIHSYGLKAGIWLAPFICERKSEIFKKHKDWLLRDKKGRIKCLGLNWSSYYGLDIYNPEVRAYIKSVFDTVFNVWGYDMVKLDFLFGAGVEPIYNKTRGEVMCDGVDFIRECCGDKLVLGCGVPLGPCFGKFEYMRIGSDMALDWYNKRIIPTHREDVSTINAINNSIFRRHLNGRAFLNDPDVFLLRDYNIRFNLEEQRLLSKIIKVFGSVIFTSDDVGRYKKEQEEILLDTFQKDNIEIIDVVVEGSIYTVNYKQNGEDKLLKFDINCGKAISI